MVNSSSSFSTRESKLIYLLSQGYSDPYIAKVLRISRNSLRAYIHRICSKYSANNRCHLVGIYCLALSSVDQTIHNRSFDPPWII